MYNFKRPGILQLIQTYLKGFSGKVQFRIYEYYRNKQKVLIRDFLHAFLARTPDLESQEEVVTPIKEQLLKLKPDKVL